MKLNKKQIVVLWLGLIIFIIVGANTHTVETFGGGRLGDRLVAVTDYGPLIFRLIGVIIATGILLVTLKK